MTLFSEKSILASLKIELKPEKKEAFADWQADFNTKIANAIGFISLEFSSPFDGQKNWVVAERFINQETLKKWQASNEYKSLIEQLKTLILDEKIESLKPEEFREKGNVTEVIVAEVSPGMEASYRAWSAKIHQIEAKFPGFRGVYIQAPQEKKKYWITLLQFDTIDNLDYWLQSKERQQILRESSLLISSLESHRVISPYAAWFASSLKEGSLPPLWKQTLLVLLVLFPIVVLELKFLSPLTSFLNPSLATFIGNALSVFLISFPMMPIAIWFLGWWLVAKSWRRTLYGATLLFLLYAVEIALFWKFL